MGLRARVQHRLPQCQSWEWTRTWTCCRPSSKCDALSFVAHGCDLSFRLKGCEAHVWNAFKSDPGEIQAGHISILSLHLDPAESSRLVGVVFLLNAPSSHGLSFFETSLTPPSVQHDGVNSLGNGVPPLTTVSRNEGFWSESRFSRLGFTSVTLGRAYLFQRRRVTMALDRTCPCEEVHHRVIFFVSNFFMDFLLMLPFCLILCFFYLLLVSFRFFL